MRYKPLCVVQTEDNAIKFFDAHDPILFKGGPNPIRLNINVGVSDGDESKEGTTSKEATTTVLLFCKRCGAAYVGAHSVTFAEVPKGVTQSPGGNA